MEPSKNAPQNIYEETLSQLQPLLTVLETTSDDELIEENRKDALEQLTRLYKKIEGNIQSLAHNAQWDALTLAFYGETGAGKSTLIESLRILLNEPEKVAQHAQFKGLAHQYDQLEDERKNIEAVRDELETTTQGKLANNQAELEQKAAMLDEFATKWANLTDQYNQAVRDVQVQQEDAWDTIIAAATIQLDLVPALIQDITGHFSAMLKFLFHWHPMQKEFEWLNDEVTRSIAQAAKLDETRVNLDEAQLDAMVALKSKIDVAENAKLRIESAQQEVKDTYSSKDTEYTKQLEEIEDRRSDLKARLETQGDEARIGRGESDYTREVTTFGLTVEGKDFRIIDLPGMEGKEEDVQDEIRNGLEQAHVIFYVNKSAHPPQRGDENAEGTIEKIAKQLHMNGEIYFVYNKPATSPRVLKDALINEAEENALAETDARLRESLGDTYQGHQVLSAYPAILSLGLFWNEKFVRSRKKFIDAFTTKENVLNHSGLKLFRDWLTSILAEDTKPRIISLNLRKVIVTLEEIKAKLDKVHSRFNWLEKELRDTIQSTSTQLEMTEGIFRNQLTHIPNKLLSKYKRTVQEAVYELIDQGISDVQVSEQLKEIAIRESEKLSEKLKDEILDAGNTFNADIQEIIVKFQRYFTELTESGMADFVLHVDFQLSIKTYGKGSLAKLLQSIVDEVAKIMAIPNGVVNLLLIRVAIVGAVIRVGKQLLAFLDKDYRHAQQKEKVSQQIDAIANDLREKIDEQLIPVMEQIDWIPQKIIGILSEQVAQVTIFTQISAEVQRNVQGLIEKIREKKDKYNENSGSL